MGMRMGSWPCSWHLRTPPEACSVSAPTSRLVGERRGPSGVVGGGIDVETARGAPSRPVVSRLQLL